MRLAGLGPAGVICEVVGEQKTAMAGAAELRRMARRQHLPILSVEDLLRHRMRHERLVDVAAEAMIPTAYGEFHCRVWRSKLDGSEHVSLSCGDLTDEANGPPLVRVHSECLTGDVFGSQRCDCGGQIDDALAMIRAAGRGMVVYLRGHEGRGIGLTDKVRAYALQDEGWDTVDANLQLGRAADARDYGAAAQILTAVGLRDVRLITNSPAKVRGLHEYGIAVYERVALPPRVTASNLTYLTTKCRRMGHAFRPLASEPPRSERHDHAGPVR
jgi:3,4-dihydroxy 2-butanone 4-phosphate synthase/GTP cyclohydrolase II